MITDDRLAAGVSLMDGAVLIYPSYYRIIRNYSQEPRISEPE